MRSLRVVLLTALLAAPALAQTPVRPRRHVGAQVSSLRTAHYDGDRQRTGAPRFRLTTAKLWAEADLARIADMSVGVGASLDAAEQKTQGAAGVVTSGFQPRNAGVYGYLLTSAYTLRGGVLLDTGGPRARGPATAANSDGVDAAYLGTDVRLQAMPLVRFTFGAAYHLTFGQDVAPLASTLPSQAPTPQQGRIDPGDQLDVYGGLGVCAGGLEVSTRLHYQRVSKGEADRTVQDNSGGYTLALIPVLAFVPPGTSLRVWLEGAGQREYGPLGITLAGTQQLASTGGVTVGVMYGF